MPANLENSAVATRMKKVRFFYYTVAIISHASKVTLKILQDRLQQYVNCELPDVQAWFRKAEKPEIKFLTSVESLKKQESSRKTSISALLCQSLWLCGSQQIGKFFKRWEYQTTLPASCEISIQVKKQQLVLDMEQWTGSILGKEYVKSLCCHSAYWTYMQSTLCEMPCWMKHKLESRLPGKISITSDMQITPP